jgi:hypothetical protein
LRPRWPRNADRDRNQMRRHGSRSLNALSPKCDFGAPPKSAEPVPNADLLKQEPSALAGALLRSHAPSNCGRRRSRGICFASLAITSPATSDARVYFVRMTDRHIEETVRYLGVEFDGVLATAEQVDV